MLAGFEREKTDYLPPAASQLYRLSRSTAGQACLDFPLALRSQQITFVKTHLLIHENTENLSDPGDCLGRATTGPARVQGALADSVSVEEPREESLEAEAVAAVRRRTVLALVGVPVAKRRWLISFWRFERVYWT